MDVVRTKSVTRTGCHVAGISGAASSGDEEKGESSRVSSSSGGSSIESGVYNLTTTIVGAGIMALPAAIKIAGLPLGLVLLLSMGYLSEHSIQLLLRSSFSAKVTSYADVMGVHFGRKGRIVTHAFVVIYTLGILVIYLIIIADVLSGSGSTHGLLEEWAGGGSYFFTSRPFVIITTVVLLFPLVSLERVDSLHFTSFFAIFLAGVFLCVTIGVCSVKLFYRTVSVFALRWLPSLSSLSSLFSFFTIIPTIMTAYVCHFNVHPIYLEMSPPKEEKMQKVVQISLFFCTFLYSITGFFGYLLFGNNVQTDLLVNFNSSLNIPGSQVLCDIVRLTFTVHLLLVFPVLHFALRASVFEMFSLSLSKRRSLVTPINMVVVSLFAIFTPSIQLVISFMGSISAISLSFTFPGLLVLKVLDRGTGWSTEILVQYANTTLGPSGVFNRRDQMSAYFLVVLGLICSFLGLVSYFSDLFLDLSL